MPDLNTYSQFDIKIAPVKLVSWDVDGTLYSIGRMKWQILRMLLWEIAKGRSLAAYRELAALRQYQIKVDSARSAGGALGELFQQKNCRELLLKMELRWYGQALRQIGPRAGLTELLSFITEREIPQVVLSDYQAAYKLESLGLKTHFASIYEGECLGFIKPSARIFEHIAADFQIPAANILHIGDRADMDEIGANAAGCQCLILGRDFPNFNSLLQRFLSAAKNRQTSIFNTSLHS